MVRRRRGLRRAVNIWSRRLHRWGAIACMAPLLVVIASGLMLQLKKQIDWVQPAEQAGSAEVPTVSMDEILSAARSAPGSGIESWADIDRLDVRPGKGITKVQSTRGVEVQIDSATGAVLQVATRRSDLIESFHDGSFFGEGAKLAVFLPTGVVLLGLWVTGAYLWILPIWAKRAGRRRRARWKRG